MGSEWMTRLLLIACMLVLQIGYAEAYEPNPLLSQNNLSDLTNVVTARTSLGLGSMATQNASSIAVNQVVVSTPAGSTSQGLTITQSPSGTLSAGTNLNLINIPSDAVSLTGPNFINSLGVVDTLNSPSVQGGRQAVYGLIQLNSPTSTSNANRNYVGVTGATYAKSGDNGTGTIKTNAAGAVFGGSFVTSAASGATNLLDLAGVEINYDAETGSSGWLKEGISIVGLGTDTVQFTHNFGITLGSASPTPTLTSGISFNDYHGYMPLAATACIICGDSDTVGTGGWTVQTGIDLIRFNITGNLLRAPNFNITGSGIVSIGASGYITTFSGPLTLAGASGATLVSGSLSVTNDIWMSKVAPSGSGPTAGLGKLELVAGTTAGTCKLIMYAGTSATAATIVDNVGAGC